MTDPNWVPTSCTLPTAEQPLRVAEWDALFAERLETVERPAPLSVRLRLTAAEGVAEQVRELAGREGDCCSFFRFGTGSDAAGVYLDITVDRTHTAVLDALAERAALRRRIR
ncbi:hypothetical protein SRB5_57070 [Streptomyces sp. RB5]|uniref:Arsenate reductase n=1 Tax=Streptomyces smaragdinus TaxID=2585196 RepID=A0A7K0CPW0_9ACTN|nr:hypothetical protein [Streptomyces smaragdinus]MQY15525.1 hypothetical protein [Streptomyces smaragdinus]